MLRTRAPLSLGASSQIPSDLHVLGLPLAFILSQDQTLHCIMFCLIYLTVLLIIESVKFGEWRVIEWRVVKPSFRFFLPTVVFFLQYPFLSFS